MAEQYNELKGVVTWCEREHYLLNLAESTATSPAAGVLPQRICSSTSFRSLRVSSNEPDRQFCEVMQYGTHNPKCKGLIRVIALIEDPGVIRRILEHLELWALLPTERSPPVDPASWPLYASLPLTYHPVPDIA